ncbi:MAG TPA: prepilin-type N-terminal cleavage/methylation domain-containing protein, partial [Verrucomicrobiota bacterium]|nr:prepilin-type N-terminal cleavage/methylation domain-containing protein [Verrucomicrobiota bacterium]
MTTRGTNRGFTLLEIMLAVVIFGMVVTAIYSSWSAILRASRAGRDASWTRRSRVSGNTTDSTPWTVKTSGTPDNPSARGRRASLTLR